MRIDVSALLSGEGQLRKLSGGLEVFTPIEGVASPLLGHEGPVLGHLRVNRDLPPVLRAIQSETVAISWSAGPPGREGGPLRELHRAPGSNDVDADASDTR